MVKQDPSSEGEGIPMEMGIEAAEDSSTAVPTGSSAPGFLPKEDTRTIKKPRLLEPSKDHEDQNMDSEHGTVYVPEHASLAGLNFDILEIILEQTGYLGDVVSVTKTCKALRNKLIIPSASGLWRRMRNAIDLPDPSDFEEPVEGWTQKLRVERFIGKEAEYANFVFGEGDCEVCEKTTKRMLASFALGLRLCGNDACKEKIKTKFEFCDARDGLAPWTKVIPTLETKYVIDFRASGAYWPRCQKITRKDWIQDGSLQDSLDTQETALRVARLRVRMTFCVALSKWRDLWQKAVRRVRKLNEALAREFAREEGWSYHEMLTETSYGRFHDMKSRRREEVIKKDLVNMRPQIAFELYEFKERTDRKKMMRLRESNKKDIWKYYQKLMSQPEKYPIIPPFTLFLNLSSIKLLQSSDLRDAKIDVRTAVRSKGFLNTMIQEELESWAEKAKRQMLATIGGPTKWNNMVAMRRMPHPVLRLDARWICKLCHDVEPKYENDGCFDFAGICRHQCKEKTKKQRGEEGSVPWDLNNFVRDEQACAALASCLKHIEAESEEPSETLKKIEAMYWRCTSCDPPLIVPAQNIAGHSHRHPTPMQIQVVKQQVIWLMRPMPNPSGVSKMLKQSSKESRLWANKVNYGCYYCKKAEEQPTSGENEEGTASSNDSGGPQTSDTASSIDVIMEEGNIDGDGTNGTNLEKGKEATIDSTDAATTKNKAFTNTFDFNGLRSHLSSKHKIHQIRDEDFWCYQPISTFKTRDIVLGWPYM